MKKLIVVTIFFICFNSLSELKAQTAVLTDSASTFSMKQSDVRGSDFVYKADTITSKILVLSTPDQCVPILNPYLKGSKKAAEVCTPSSFNAKPDFRFQPRPLSKNGLLWQETTKTRSSGQTRINRNGSFR